MTARANLPMVLGVKAKNDKLKKNYITKTTKKTTVLDSPSFII